MSALIRGFEIVLGCPLCGATARLEMIEPEDVENAVSWTDGFKEVQGVPPEPEIARCHACENVYWIREAHLLAEIVPGVEVSPEHAQWQLAPFVQPVREDDCHQALDAGLAIGPEQELALRVLAWWRHNDRFRGAETIERFPTDERAIANLERLIELCAGGNHELLLFRVEALRELGRFADAGEALSGLCSDYDSARERFERLIASQTRDLDLLFS